MQEDLENAEKQHQDFTQEKANAESKRGELQREHQQAQAQLNTALHNLDRNRVEMTRVQESLETKNQEYERTVRLSTLTCCLCPDFLPLRFSYIYVVAR